MFNTNFNNEYNIKLYNIDIGVMFESLTVSYKFKNGIRGAHPEDTYGQQMRPMAMTLANEETIKNVAAYIATLK